MEELGSDFALTFINVEHAFLLLLGLMEIMRKFLRIMKCQNKHNYKKIKYELEVVKSYQDSSL